MDMIRETNNFQLYGKVGMPDQILIKNVKNGNERLIAVPDLENVKLAFNTLNDEHFDKGCLFNIEV